jgi:hypothetical protein
VVVILAVVIILLLIVVLDGGSSWNSSACSISNSSSINGKYCSVRITENIPLHTSFLFSCDCFYMLSVLSNVAVLIPVVTVPVLAMAVVLLVLWCLLYC